MAGSSSQSTTASGWNQSRPERVDPRKHRWQGARRGAGRTRAPGGGRRRLRFLLSASAAVGLLALFTYGLLFAPVKTPLVIIAPADFAYPVPPTAWIGEDVQRLKQLDGKTFRVVDASPAWTSKQTGLDEVDRLWKSFTGFRGNDGVAVVYVALPGLVTEDGTPAMLLPGMSAWSPAEWLPLRELLDHLSAGDADLEKVVLLDCRRAAADWNLGLVADTFVDRVEQLVAAYGNPRLHVITASSAGQDAWASAELRGSAFGRAAAEALAGASDRAVEPHKIGNRNRRVSLRELHRYVAQRVDAWARANRGASQTPRLFSTTAENADFRIAWSLDASSLRQMAEEEELQPPPAAAVPADDRARLWRQLDALRGAAPFQTHPVAWRDLEHGLLRLERLSQAGEAYVGAARTTLDDLRRRLDEASARSATLGERPTRTARAALLGPQDFEDVPSGRLHSAAWSQTFGTVAPAAAASILEQLRLLAARPDGKIPNDLVGRSGLSAVAAESHFARLALRYQVARRWNDPQVAVAGLALHERGERARVGGDERALHWLQPALAAYDRQRRTALDRVLAGPEGGPAATPWNEATTALDRIDGGPQGLRPEIERALAVRDRVAAELAYLARWQTATGGRIVAEEASSATVADAKDAAPPGAKGAAVATSPQDGAAATSGARISGLIERLLRLSEALDDRTTTPTAGPPAFLAEARALEAEFDAAKRDFLAAFDLGLHRSEADPAVVRKLSASLDVAWLAADRRAAAAEKLAAWSKQLHTADGTPADKQAADGTKGETSTTEETPEDVAAWGVHPLARLLLVDPRAAAPPADGSKPAQSAFVERLQARCRERLLELPRAAIAVSASTDGPRDVLARADRAARYAPASLFAPHDREPAQLLRRFDLQQALLHDVAVRLDDCWGGTGDDVAAAADARPFFEVAAADHLHLAEELLPAPPPIRAALEDLHRRLARRRAAALRGVAVAVEADVPDSSGDRVSVDVVVRSGLVSASAADTPTKQPGVAESSTANDDGLAAGRGFVVARNSKGELLPLVGGTFEVPPSSQGARVELAGEVPPAAGSSFDAVAVFRGNEFAVPFMRPGLGGIVVDYRPQLPDTARLTVFGDRPQQSSVMFILDCSSSMAAELPVELVDADRLPRLDVARGALNALLEQLAIRADTRVGVRLFGHRAGWAKGESSKLVTQTDYAGPIPDDLAPAADVELVLPLGRFDSVEAGQVAGRLKSVRPWGQSPLYLSIIDSLRDFTTDRDETEKSIVVITDGANYQFTPAGSGTSAPPHQTAADVLSAWESAKVPVYILGFRSSEAADAAAEREFTQLAERTGGKFFVVENGRDLLQALRERLGLGSYRVEAEGIASVAGAQGAKLNTPLTFEGLRRGAVSYAVRFQSGTADVLLEGGEALELYAAPNGRITARPYARELPVDDVMSLDGDPRRLTVRAHRPRPGDRSVTFPVSWQEADAPFTRRPEEHWIEITPITAGRADLRPRYVFYDRRYEPDAPVPLAACTATDWPSESRRARIAVWCKYGRTEPQQFIAAADVLRDRAAHSAGVPVRNLGGSRLRVLLPEPWEGAEAGELKVIEEHGPDARGVHLLKITLEGLAYERVVRRYDPERGVVVHTFHLPASVRGVPPPAAARIAVTTRSAAHDGAFQIEAERTLTVDIGGAGDVLPLDAATGVR